MGALKGSSQARSRPIYRVTVFRDGER